MAGQGQYWVATVEHEKVQGRLRDALELLREALGHINAKPWEEPTLLHARVSEFVGEPMQHAGAVVLARSGKL